MRTVSTETTTSGKMTEWAVLSKSGRVVTIITSERKPQERGIFREEHSIIPVANVPAHILNQYQYWNERP